MFFTARPVLLTSALLLSTLALTSCGRGFGDGATSAAKADASLGDLFAGPALWDDPQNAPHPMFNWPTISHPPTNKSLPPYWAPPPARALPATISAVKHVARADDVPSGGSLVVGPGFGKHSSLVDISDPQNPARVGAFFGPDGRAATIGYAYGATGHQATEAAGIGSDRGAAIIAYPSGRLVTVIATSGEIEVWDITDPEEPNQLPPLRVESSHKVGVVPGTPIVYNAGTRGGGSTGNFEGTDHTEIFDLTDPDNPEFVQNFPNGYSCHHIFFWNNPAQNKFRAVCAGVQVTQIWDTADPRNPKVISTIPVHHGVSALPGTAVSPLIFSHSAGLNRDGTVLYVGDEMGGGGVPPGCVLSVPTPAGNVSTPVGAIWFYDISDETNPILQGWYSATKLPATGSALSTCTAHHGRLVPDPKRDLLAMAFYGNGVILIDFTNPVLPKTVGQFSDGGDTWEAWYHQGYIVTGDLTRGLDILTFE
jgi:hypothetical protein